MTARETSHEAYRQIKAKGLLSRQLLGVYAALVKYGARTATELAECMRLNDVRATGIRHMVSRRLPELRDLGVVAEDGIRECRVTGRSCVTWKATGFLPRPVERKQTRLQRAEARIETLEAENKRLRIALDAAPAQQNLL